MANNPKPKIRYSSRGKIIEPSDELNALIKDHELDSRDYNDKKKIVLLTRKNANAIEKTIKEDNDYIPFSKIIFDFFGKEKVSKNEDNALFIVAREIDRDNSTNVWRYKTNRENFRKMVAYMAEPENKFFEELKDGNTQLPDKLVDNSGNGLKSLSSKICKYLDEFMFGGDKYYINDRVVRHVLLHYLDAYGIEHDEIKSNTSVDELSYEKLYGFLEKLHIKRDEEYKDTIKKSELDHILWYCYKSFDV